MTIHLPSRPEPNSPRHFWNRLSTPSQSNEDSDSPPADILGWLHDITGHELPYTNVCPDHDPPAQFILDLWEGKETDALVLANRAGGKTEALAALHVALNRWRQNYEISHIGAIQIQARRCYTYYRRFLSHPDLRDRAPDPHITETMWSNGSSIEILPGTEAQTQGGHPHLVAFDELEQGKRQPYENAKSMPVSYGDTPGLFVATSTRQSGLGLMQAALDEAEASGTKVYTWCVLETMDGSTCYDDAGEELCNGCPIFQDCEGRALGASGWRSRDEILSIYRRVGRDTWEAQHLCRKPEAKSLIYSPFTRANISEDAEYRPGEGPIYVSYDWGFTDPTHVGLWQYRGEAFHLFDEMHGSNRSEREWVRDLIRRIVALPGYDGPDYDEWSKRWDRQDWPDAWPDVWPELAVGDPSAVQLRSELKEHGIATANPNKVKHEVVKGQDVLRAAFRSGGELRRLFVNPRCTEFIRAVGNYRAKELADGSFDAKPDPDPANHRFSHPCDSARYLVWRLRYLLGLTGESE